MAKTAKNIPAKSKTIVAESPKTTNLPQIPIPLIASMGIVCCIYTLRVMDPVLIPKFLGYSIFIFGLFIWLVFKGKTQDLSELFAQNALLWTSTAYILLSGIIGIYGASMLGDGLLEWGKWVLGALGMWGIVAFYRKKENFREILCQTTSIFTLIACAFAFSDISKLLAVNNLTHTTSYSINSLFGHKNVFSEVLFLMLPFNLYGGFYGKKAGRSIAIVAAILSLIFMIALLSRAIWITLAIATAITGIIYLINAFNKRKNKAEQLKKMALLGVISIAIVATSLGLYAVFSKGDAIQKQFSSITNIHHSANEDRLKKWEQTWQLFEEQPITGIGLGDWKIEILRFITKNSEVEQGRLFFQRPHNDYLWILSEMGIFTFVAYLSIFVAAIMAIFRLLKRTENEATQNWLYLLLHAVIGYLIFSAFAFPKERIEEIFFLHLIFAAILYENDLVFSAEKPTKNLPILAYTSIALASLCIYVGYERFEGETELRQFEINNKSGKFDAALQHAENAYRPMLEMDPISTPIRFFSGTLHLQMKKYPEAKEHLEAAHALSPYHVQVMNNLAGLYFMTNKTEESRMLYEKVLVYAPKYEDALLSLAAISFNAKKTEKAFYYLCQMDTASANPRYQQYFNSIFPPIKQMVLSKISEPQLLSKVNQIFTQKLWYIGISQRAEQAHRDFTQQTIAEAMMEMLRNKELSVEEGEIWKQKYGIKD